MEDFKKVLATFGGDDIYEAAHALLTALEVPVQRLKSTRYSTLDFFSVSHPSHDHIDAIYAAGLVTDEAFDEKSDGETLESALKKDKYDALGVFVVEVNKNKPSRSLLSDLTRRINRQTTGFPVLVIFKYSIDDQVHIAFANAAREDYKRTTQEGEKIGKVSILRDINTNQLHAGHERMLIELAIKRKGSNPVNSYEELYAYWQKVFDVSLLSKKFYRELSNWYFWALKEVRFPNGPNIFDENIDGDEKKHREAIIEHNGKNVIRMLTRILFVWFVKEKGLVPELLFDERFIESELLKDFTPQKPQGIFSTGKTNSKYYRAVLQNLFFGGLNQERGKRAFRKAKMHHNVTNLMRYEECFKDGQLFIDLLENNVPFMNGGLFECLDEPHPEKKGKKGGDIIIYNDGFSDRPDNLLSVPDYLFFDLDEEVDLSDVSGIKSADYKKAKTRGLLQILKSYKFTISENTPIEEDVALDPELLGKVFENLLASYNPETKTTARKQTGSFYTPREIVNYMVDESLIAYLKNTLIDTSMSDELLDEKLRELVSFDAINPFVENHEYTKSIINALDKCKILDPACGSGAFPMGALQKMVHLLQKLDPDNEHWKEIQLKKAMEATEAVFAVKDKSERETRLIEISDAFDATVNDPDYARKLFLIENCIYGVDIQPIATQISKLRFFISLVVEQRVSKKLDNFGIRPLPNLETKFVTANTLIGIDKTEGQQLFNTEKIKLFQAELKDVRHKLFSVKKKSTKLKYRKKDEELRNAIAEELKQSGWPNYTAEKLAGWDPYDQNASSSFFDSEWMFDMKNGFDVVIANPPYIGHKGGAKRLFRQLKSTTLGSLFNNERMDIFYYFFHFAINITSTKGIISFITTNYYPTADSAIKLRQDIFDRTYPFIFVDFNELKLFESAKGQHNLLSFLSKNEISKQVKVININAKNSKSENELKHLLTKEAPETTITLIPNTNYRDAQSGYFLIKGIDERSVQINEILKVIAAKSSKTMLDDYNLSQGVVSGIDKISPKHARRLPTLENKIGQGVFVVSKETRECFSGQDKEILKPWFKNSDISKYYVNESTDNYLIHTSSEFKLDTFPSIKDHLERYKEAILSRNFESGELSKAKRKGAWWALSSSRRDFDFTRPKIVSPQRSYKNTFGYTEKEWCASADVYFITAKTNAPIPLVALVTILNSSLFYLWLYHRGKRKGEMLELYLTPLAAIPIPDLNKNEIDLLSLLGSLIFNEYTRENEYYNLFDQIANSVIIEYYFLNHMCEKNINVKGFAEQDIKEILRDKDFDKLSAPEKEAVIEQLHSLWSHPDNEVVKRMAQFKEKSPDILKPILES